MNKLLITDSFFVSQKNVDQLTSAGYEVVRLNKAAATEDELITALEGVSVYILGGTEQVTDRVLSSTKELKSILFPGVDYSKFISGLDTAQKMNISIFNAPGANAVGVAEFAIATALAMQRQLFSISRNGSSKFVTTKSVEGANVGIIGMGNIGSIILEGVQAFKPRSITYFCRSKKVVEAKFMNLRELVEQSDIVFLTLPASAGLVFDSELIQRMKSDSLLVSISPNTLIDYDALYYRLNRNEIRAAIDWPSPSPSFDALPLDTWLSFNSHGAYNTFEAIENVNASVTTTAVELLTNNLH
jgi:D-3-phosphoglycerate dehydrogenase